MVKSGAGATIVLNVIGKFFGYLLRSLFISAVMFVILFSVVTKEFPPNFLKLQTTYHSLQELARLGQMGTLNIQKRKALGTEKSLPENDDSMVDELEKINSQRVKLGSQLMAEGSVESEDQAQVLERLRGLETQLFKLQQRVAELESQQQK